VSAFICGCCTGPFCIAGDAGAGCMFGHVEVVVVEDPFVLVCVFGVLEFGFVVVVCLGQFVVFLLLVVVGVVVAGWVMGVVGVVGVVGGVVCAMAGTARLTRSPAAEAKPRIARELMRLDSPFQLRQGQILNTQSNCDL